MPDVGPIATFHILAKVHIIPIHISVNAILRFVRLLSFMLFEVKYMCEANDYNSLVKLYILPNINKLLRVDILRNYRTFVSEKIQ